MKKLLIDNERGTATVPLENGPMILMISAGKAQLLQLHDYGKFNLKTHEGKISHFENTETGKF